MKRVSVDMGKLQSAAKEYGVSSFVLDFILNAIDGHSEEVMCDAKDLYRPEHAGK